MREPIGLTLIGIFLVLSTCILVASTITLLLPGTWLDMIWVVKREAYAGMLPYRHWAGAGFLALGVLMACASVGWWQRRRWAWRLVLVIFAVNMAGDAARLFKGEVWEGAFGIVMVLLLFLHVRSARVRSFFPRGA